MAIGDVPGPVLACPPPPTSVDKLMDRRRLDERLVADGLLPDLRTAQAWILAGDVLVTGTVCEKPGTRIAGGATVTLRRSLEKYASRGGLKLEAALARFRVPVTGRVALDAGASTGGFTDCLLQHGAARVYAVDAGYGQLRGKLRSDRRVVNLEKTNISEVRLADLDPPIDLAVFDLSYLSAARAMPVLARLFTVDPDIIGLVKPLFEGVQPADMKEPASLRAALVRVLAAIAAQGLAVQAIIPSPILGSGGTVEFLVRALAGQPLVSPDSLVDGALAELAALSFTGE
jgi:23S rRNA (cytidine1920-2'-O)/16S rRNA (cytidine1409-2'-O)-methyltransferase